MRISKLNLYGFKSFPDRTVIQLGEGVSCVVGPNGCGKSNVLDAIKWCIGEQSAKNLRGSEMLDVIFAGSTERPPVGFAEVSLTLSANERPFPGEYADLSELEIGRRLHRSGRSEYFINRSKCRRRDIVNLFMDTGVGSSLYSFIEQGKVESVVNASPVDRRSLIDEAAGISGYKSRRAEALQRLAATGTQLDRAADVADELGRRLRSVRTQVRRAARFRRFRGLIRQREIALALIKYAALCQDRRVLREAARGQDLSMERLNLEEQQHEHEVRSREAELETIEASTSQWRDQLADLDGSLREMNAKDDFLSQQRTQSKELRARSTADLAELVEELERAEEALVYARSEAEGALGGRQELNQDLQAAQGALAEQQRDKQRAVTALTSLDEELQLKLAELATAQARYQQRQERLEAAPARREQLALRLEEVESQTRDLAAKLEELKLARIAGEEASGRLGQELAQAAQAQANAHTVVETAVARVEQLETSHRESTARNEAAVQALMAQLEGGLAHIETEAAKVRAAGDVAVEALNAQWQERLRGLREEQLAETAGARRKLEDKLEGLRQPDGVAQGRLERERDEKIGRAQAAHAEQLAQTMRDHHQQLTQLETKFRAGHAAEREERRAQVGQLEVALGMGRQAMRQLREREAELLARVAAFEGRLVGADESIRALLPTAVDGHGSLYDADAWSDAEEWKIRAVGERLFLPTFASVAEVLAVRATIGSQTSLRGILCSSAPEEQLLGGLEQAESLEEALEFHLETKGAVVVRGTGERIDADGVFLLGEHEDLAQKAVALREESTRLREKLDLARNELGKVRAQHDAGERALSGDKGRLAELSEALLEETESFHGRLGAALESTRGQQAQSLSQLRLEVADELEGLRLEYGQLLRDAQYANERSVAETRAAGERALHELQSEHLCCLAELEEARELELFEQRAATLRTLEDAKTKLRAEQRVEQRENQEQKLLAERELDGVTVALNAAREKLDARRIGLERESAVLREQRARQLERSMANTQVQEGIRAADQRWVELEERRREALAEQAGLETLAAEPLEEEECSILALREALEGQREHRQTAQERIGAFEIATESLVLSVQGLAIELGTLETRIAAARERKQHSEALLTSCMNRHRRSEHDRESASTMLDQLDEQALQLNVERARVVAERGQVWDRVESARARAVSLKEGVHEAREVLKAHRERVEQLRAGVSSDHERLQSVQVDIEVIRRRISERYQISLAAQLDRLDAKGAYDILPGESAGLDVVVGRDVIPAVEPLCLQPSHMENVPFVEGLLAELDDYREQLEQLGQVNLAAFDEFEELSKRHSELEAQRADLEDSVQSVRRAIAKMNRLCRQRFRDAFDAVNEQFTEAYPSLVGGGSARLALTDEEDLLETGVDIFVQPPGKRLQNLSLLSGGEKAMAAIALLLALFRVKPSPFCVLDEVDAPLDEANGARFNRMLREMSQFSQFLVITHNRKTMECADTLYGITMENPGVSRIVTVELGAY
jgi:chromosome segregation protein